LQAGTGNTKGAVKLPTVKSLGPLDCDTPLLLFQRSHRQPLLPLCLLSHFHFRLRFLFPFHSFNPASFLCTAGHVTLNALFSTAGEEGEVSCYVVVRSGFTFVAA
jgi:hypothetical protein